MTIARPDARPSLSEAEIIAIRAVHRGHASSGQQKLAMVTIHEKILGLTALPNSGFTAGESAFASGKQWAGMVIAEIAGLRLWAPEPEREDT